MVATADIGKAGADVLRQEWQEPDMLRLPDPSSIPSTILREH
jgi:hypothetical protein